MSGEKKTLYNGLSEFEETVLFLTRPYIKITVVCWFLSLYCTLSTGVDFKSSSFVLGLLTLIIDSILLLVLYFRAKRIRRKKKEEAFPDLPENPAKST